MSLEKQNENDGQQNTCPVVGDQCVILARATDTFDLGIKLPTGGQL